MTESSTVSRVIPKKRGLRTLLRIRPGRTADTSGITRVAQAEVTVSGNAHVTRRHADVVYAFDDVYGQTASQEEVFDAVVGGVHAALAGHRAGVLAYGQTGSGKTHTLLGSLELGEDAGILPRAVEVLFTQARPGAQVTGGGSLLD